MCKVGDIILINKYYSENNEELSRHPFVVVNDESGQIEGLPFDLVCSVMSSFKSKEQRKKKLSYPGNLEITIDDGVQKNGFIKANQLHYFLKNKLDYTVLGSVNEDLFNDLITLIQQLFQEEEIIVNINNIKAH